MIQLKHCHTNPSSDCQPYTFIPVDFVANLFFLPRRGAPRTLLRLLPELQWGTRFKCAVVEQRDELPSKSLSRALRTLHIPGLITVQRSGHEVCLQVDPSLRSESRMKVYVSEREKLARQCTDLEIYLWLYLAGQIRGLQKPYLKFTHKDLAQSLHCKREDVNMALSVLVAMGLLRRTKRDHHRAIYTYAMGHENQESSHKVARFHEGFEHIGVEPKVSSEGPGFGAKVSLEGPPRILDSLNTKSNTSSYAFSRKAVHLQEAGFVNDVDESGSKSEVLEALTREVVKVWEDVGGFIVLLSPRDRDELKKHLAMWKLDYALTPTLLVGAARNYLQTIKDPNCTLVHRPLLKEFYDYRRDWVKRFINGPQKSRPSSAGVTSDFDQESLEIARRLLGESGS